jgi:NAD(P)-dependent dehydrogenase (short-subunit alcohol dehydrogenase family)
MMALEIDLSGRLAVVTGAGKGIGRAICLELARAGADIFGVSRTYADLESLGEEVDVLGVRYSSCVADLSSSASAEEVARRAEAFGAVNILVNNAGVARTGPAEDLTEADWDYVMDTNLKGAFFVAQAIGRNMLERGSGRIVNVSSQAGLVGLRDHAAYCASKAGLGLLTKVLAVERGPRGVAVNAVAPTVILTPMGEQVWGDPKIGSPMLAKIPLGRFGQPEEVAGTVAFLASDLAGMINGEIVAIDGGYTAQ